MSKFKMSISSTILENFGEHLYDSIPPVLAEIVANAWDADATEVNITVDKTKQQIIIEDNGIGMNVDDINNKFLDIGHKKREHLKDTNMKSPKYGRLYMGRKGVGKLAIFAISDSFTLETIPDSDTSEKNAFICSKQELMKNKDITKYDIPETECHRTTCGTTITVTNIPTEKRYDDESIKLMLLQRFPNLNDSFTIKINGAVILWKDNARLFKKLQYVFFFGEHDNIKTWKSIFQNIKPDIIVTTLEATIENNIYGWIGSTKNPSDLKINKDWSWNVISVIVRGKLAQEDILKHCKQNSLPPGYMTGMVFADYLDQDNEEDIATTSRQSIKESSRYRELLNNMQSIVSECISKWNTYRQEEETDQIKKIPSIKAWYDREQQDKTTSELSKHYIKHIASTIHSFKISKDTEDIEQQAEEIATLCEGAILSYEHAKRSNTVKDLVDSIGKESSEVQQGIFKAYVGKYSLYISEALYPIIRERLEIIEKLQNCIEKNAIEKEFQILLHNNLWLIRPLWENISYTLDKVYKNKLEDYIKTTIDDSVAEGRIDISIGKIDGSYVIIELKKYDVKPKMNDLDDQIIKYRKYIAEQANLENHNKQVTFPNEYKKVQESDVITYIILGTYPSNWDDKRSLRDGWINTGVYVLFYDELLKDAQNQYQRYIEENSKANQVLLNIKNIRLEIKEQLLGTQNSTPNQKNVLESPIPKSDQVDI